MRPVGAAVLSNGRSHLHDAISQSPWSAAKMAAPMSCAVSRLQVLFRGLEATLPRQSPVRCIQTTSVCLKNRAARVRVGKRDKPVTYEQAHPPHYIAHRKGWLSQHTSNLDGEGGAAERTIEDVYIRKFMYGTFHGCLANEIVIKRRANLIVICAVLNRYHNAQKLYFLTGYTETLLSYLYKCPVKLELQTVEEKVIYKYL
ncbi:small ribosomal subunit protein uS3m isoform X2 [Pseudophryne corroboree]|uniref:small ribosomal subunit protein uS3m isoform X2 n=1 Tax=Pseudophryne corroboree TaxID=495146 RepID=UPI00308209B7